MFIAQIGVMWFLAACETGATIGMIQKQLPVQHTRGQVERMLKPMIQAGFVRVEKVAYRPHIEGKRYHLSAVAYGWIDDMHNARLEKLKQRSMEQINDLLKSADGGTMADMPF